MAKSSTTPENLAHQQSQPKCFSLKQQRSINSQPWMVTGAYSISGMFGYTVNPYFNMNKLLWFQPMADFF